ncbi:MAG: tRNA (adenosine(37)-N6)-threonylcarbamoyltransferase complex ATPase subunit type 1 TsaE [Patescibacteria group bacterium]
MKKVVCQSSSAGVTHAFAEKLVANLAHGGLVLLSGELGAGKTTFVQGIAQALHIDRSITSPTFTLMNVYETSHLIIRQLVHIDLYRLSDNAELTTLDIPTWLSNPAALVIIEWPERAPDLWSNALGTIQFGLGDTVNQRTLTMTGSLAAYFA